MIISHAAPSAWRKPILSKMTAQVRWPLQKKKKKTVIGSIVLELTTLSLSLLCIDLGDYDGYYDDGRDIFEDEDMLEGTTTAVQRARQQRKGVRGATGPRKKAG